MDVHRRVYFGVSTEENHKLLGLSHVKLSGVTQEPQADSRAVFIYLFQL